MSRRHLFAVALSLGVFLLASDVPQARKPPKPTPDLPGTLTFDCRSDFGTISCTTGDRIIGDSRNYPGIGAPEGGEGAFLRDVNKELWVGMGSGLYKQLIDFNEPSGIAPCALTNNCRFTTARFPGNSVLIDQENAEIQSNVVTGPGGDVVANGLMSIGVGASGWARLKITFTDPLGDPSLLWGIRFNSFEYAGSSEIPVSRIDVCTWRFGTDGDELAGLLANGSGRNKGRTDEGLYVLRFHMNLQVPALCP